MHLNSIFKHEKERHRASYAVSGEVYFGWHVSLGPQRTDRASSLALVTNLVSSVDWWVGWGSRRDGLAQLMMTYQSCCFQNETANQQHPAKTPKESYPNNTIFRFPAHTLQQPQYGPNFFLSRLCHRDWNKPPEQNPFGPSQALCFRILNNRIIPFHLTNTY